MKVSVSGDVPANPELTALEQAVVSAAAAADERGPALLAQLRGAQAASRTHSGVGFMTRLRLAAGVPALPGSAALPVVRGEHPQLDTAAEFQLQLKDGRLHCIEAFCFAGLWPQDESGFRLQVGR